MAESRHRGQDQTAKGGQLHKAILSSLLVISNPVNQKREGRKNERTGLEGPWTMGQASAGRKVAM